MNVPLRSMFRFAAMAGACVLAFAAIPVRAQVPGDANNDGSVTVQDVDLILGHLLGKSLLTSDTLQRADANGDGALDVADLVVVQTMITIPPEKTFTLPSGVPLTMVKIPRGSFQMGLSQSEVEAGWGNSTEQPRHLVTINYDYYMGKYEVTQRQWLAMMGTNPSYFQPSNGSTEDLDRPVEKVSWDDVQNFESAINGMGLDGSFRLPSEAEWEYAARGGTQTRFHFGASTCFSGSSCTDCDLSQYAWYCGNDNPYGTKTVGQKLPNPFGLYDTMGNVWEWVEDYFLGNYSGAPSDGTPWVSPKSSVRVFRGGVWFGYPVICLPSFRYFGGPDIGDSDVGFRLAWTP